MGATRIVVNGASGRMGQALQAVRDEFPELHWMGTLERAFDFAALPAFDVLIDFSAPEALPRSLAACAARSAALVCGTTGLSLEDEAGLERLAKIVPVVHATNFSLGLVALRRAVAELAAHLDWDCEIVETHHRNKRDAPSGTALTLVREVREARKQTPVWRDRIAEAREQHVRGEGSVGVAAMRGGGVVGDHSVHFFGAGERIALHHHAEDRLIFARGALAVAARIRGMAPGRHSVDAVLWR
jgi:4-hydroxy-tetrahydrodipicolinate reductase